MDFENLSKVFGPISAILIVAIIVLWREWRKTEQLFIEELKKHSQDKADMISNYNNFESVLKGLMDVIKD